jgi:hypothetical protein
MVNSINCMNNAIDTGHKALMPGVTLRDRTLPVGVEESVVRDAS